MNVSACKLEMVLHVQANTHQGDSRFQGSGQQCTAMAMTALAYHQILEVARWNAADIDYILNRGDQLYVLSSKFQNVSFLLPSDVVQSIDIGFKTVTVKTMSAQSGVLSLECARQMNDLFEHLDRVQNTCILTFGQVHSSYAVGIIKSVDWVYVFDSHSRNCQGFCVPDGYACVSKFDNVKEVTEFIVNLALSVGMLNECLFEVVGVCLWVEDVFSEEMDGEEDVPLIQLLLKGQHNIPTHPQKEIEDDDSDYDVPLARLSVQGKMKELRDNTMFQMHSKEAQTITDMDHGRSSEVGIHEIDFDTIYCLIAYESAYEDILHKCATQLDANNQRQDVLGGEINFPLDTSDLANSKAASPSTSPQDIHQSRKRKKNVEEWKSNLKKKQRNCGEEYEKKSGEIRRKRELKPGCGKTCRNKCQSAITQEERTKIFHCFWQMGCLEKQREYLTKVVSREGKKTAKLCESKQKRNWTFKYYLKIGDKDIKVCKKMFLDTLDISERVVFTAIGKLTDLGVCESEKRGKCSGRGLSEEKERIKQHINSFPRLESHYARKDSRREYLESNLSILKMYEMYIDSRKKEGCLKPASERTYRDVFNNDFNIGFHKRMKDRCDTCTAYENTKSTESEEYKEHRRLVEESRLFKSKIKDGLLGDQSKCAAVFDLEEVLPCPSSNESCLYYKRKLSTYNLTVFDYRNGQGHCYVWPETEALRGSNEIASCVFMYLTQLKAEGISQVVLFSDSCGGQNRNRNFLSMLWYVMKQRYFETIEHVFFVSGHSQNEGDSMHSTIENASRHVPVYTPAQWAQLIRGAKRKQPLYLVEEMNRANMFDFKKIASVLKNFELDTNKDKVKWLKVKRFSLSSKEPNIVKVYYDYSENYRFLNLLQRVRVVHQLPDDKQIQLQKASLKPYPLNKDKYSDLVDLCDKNIIPQAHQEFYKSLPHQ